MFKNFTPELFLSLKNYNRSKLLKDIIAGVIVGIIALPLSIALSIASGAGPGAGLITAIIAGIVAAVFGGSRSQVTGPTGAFVVIISGVIFNFQLSGLLLATLMAGIIIVLMSIFRLGKLIKFIPLSVIVGFTVGIAATIFISQLNDFFGLGLKPIDLPSESLAKFIAIISHVVNINFMTLVLGAVAIVILLLVPKISKKLPAALIAIIICTLLNIFFGCPTLGNLYGSVTINFMPSIGFIDLSLVPRLIMPAITIALLASIESLLSAVVADSMQGTKHNPNTEMMGQGLANIASSFFGGLPATGAIARTSANIKNGGQTPVSAIIHSFTVLMLALVFMPLAVYIPMTVFAAILIIVCKNMLNIKEIVRISNTTAVDVVLMAGTFVLTIVFDLVVAISVCTALALIIEIIKNYKHKKLGESVLLNNIFKLEGVISYMNCDKLFSKKCTKEPVIFDMEKVTSIDANAICLLIECAEKQEIIEIKVTDIKIKYKLQKHEEISKYIA